MEGWRPSMRWLVVLVVMTLLCVAAATLRGERAENQNTIVAQGSPVADNDTG
jgi:hypothetical protein